MPTECERNSIFLGAQKVYDDHSHHQNQHHHHHHHQHLNHQNKQQQERPQRLEIQHTTGMNDTLENIVDMTARSPSNDSMSQSQTSITSPTIETTNGLKGSTNGGESKKTSLKSPDPTSYVTKARVTRPIPPPPSYNPMQFVQIKPCNLYQTAQEQLKKAEEVKKIKEIKKEEPEDWQNNLDNWKSSRRKRVEHIIDRVVEVKKLELEEHDRSRRKSKTFSEMIEERGERAGGRVRTKLTSLAIYNEDESNDLSDLGIGTSSASGKSSLSEDYDNNSVTSENAELDKTIQNENNHTKSSIQAREYIASPGYETSSSTAPASSPDPCEYTYEGAIQDYKQRISRAASGNYKVGTNINNSSNNNNPNSTNEIKNTSNMNGNGECHGASKAPPNTLSLSTKEQTETYSPRRGNKIEDRLLSFEVTSPSDQDGIEKVKVDVPKIDISKRKEIFESQRANSEDKIQSNGVNGSEGAPKVTLRDRFKLESSASTEAPVLKKETKRLSGDVSSIRERLQSLEQQKDPSSSVLTTSRSVDIPVPSLKDRLSSLQNATKKEEIKKPPVALVDARQLEIMKKEEETAKQRMQQSNSNEQTITESIMVQNTISEVTIVQQPETETDMDDSGIHTTDDAVDNVVLLRQQEQEQQLNAAIAALAVEEKQLEEAANAVNQIEAEFDELSTATTVASNATNQPQLPYEMDFSINEALELALEAIDKETKLTANDDVEEEISEGIKTQIKIEIETMNRQVSKTARINQNIDEEKHSVEEQQLVESKNNQSQNQSQRQSQRQEIHGQEVAMYVPQEMHSTTTTTTVMTKTTKSEAVVRVENENEPIYENIPSTSSSSSSSSPTSTSTSSSSPSSVSTTSVTKADVAANTDTELLIIPKTKSSHEDRSSNDNNNDNNKHHQPANQHYAHAQMQSQTQSLHLHHRNNQSINSSSNKTNQNNYENNNNNNSIDLITTKTTLTTPPPQQPTTTAMTKNTSTTATTETTTTTTTTTKQKSTTLLMTMEQQKPELLQQTSELEPYYQVPKSSEPYYDAPRHLRPVPLYENIEIFYNGLDISTVSGGLALEPPKEKPPPPPAESPPPINDTDESVNDNTDTWSSSDNTYETISSRHSHRTTVSMNMKNNGLAGEHPSPPIKRVNSTKRIKKELRNKRSSFLGIDASALDDEDHYLEMTVAPPPDMVQFLQQERQLEKQLYMKTAGLCDSSDTGESRDSGVSENHSRQSSEHYTNSSEENERHIDVDIGVDVGTPVYHHDGGSTMASQTPLLQTVKGDSAESWTESATAAAAASQSLTEATATANAKMLSIEEKIREQEEVLRVERELLQLEQEELKRQRENLMLRENMARRELQHGAKMLMSANRHSLQELNGNTAPNILTKVPSMPTPLAALSQLPQVQPQQQIYANVPNLQQQYYQMDIDYRKSMSDLNEFSSKRGMLPPTPPTKPMRAMHISNGRQHTHLHPHQAQDEYVVMTANQRFGGSLVKIAAPAPTAAPRSHIYSNYQHRSQQNLCTSAPTSGQSQPAQQQQTHAYHGNMTRNTLHALSATPKPKYTDGWVQQQQQQHQNRKSLDPTTHLANDPAWLSAYQQKRKSMPDSGSAFTAYNGNHWLVQEAEQRRITEEQRRSLSNGSTPLHQKSNGKPLPDAIIQTLTERVQSKGIGERKRLDNFKNSDRSPLHAAAAYHQNHYPPSHRDSYTQPSPAVTQSTSSTSMSTATTQDKVLSVSGKKKCSHCGDELGRGAAMIIESLLLFYHINCFKCCVCHVQLGDGLNGTDVRVRNHKLHCQNCYSSDDGIKFSCV